MSGPTNSGTQCESDVIFKNRYHTDFMRVPQTEDKEAPVRHPGIPTSPLLRPRSPTTQYGGGHASLGASASYGSGFPSSNTFAYPTSGPGVSVSEDVLACPVCKTDFDSVMRRPLLLPGCGHTLCSACVRERSATGVECPTCKRSYPGATVDLLPINVSLEALLLNKSGLTTLQRIIQSGGRVDANCLHHGIRLSFWCRGCEEVACGECLFDRHPASGHTLAKLQDVADEIRESAVSTVTACHGDATKLFSNSLLEFVSLLSKLHEASKLMQDTRKLVAAAQCSEDFTSVTSVYDAIKKLSRELEQVKKEKVKNAETKEANEDNETKDAGHEAGDVPDSVKDLEEGSGEEKTTPEAADAKAGAEVQPSVPTPQKRKAPKVSLQGIEQLGKVAPSSEACQVHAMHTDGRLAKVQTEELGLHIYSLSQFPSAGYSVAVRLGLLTEFLQRENPVVFLDFNSGAGLIGRVYLRLRGDMRRSAQFLHLCLGTLGPSYRGSRVDGICDEGSPGEYLRLGDYTGQGGQGGVGLIDGLEWGNKWSDSKRAGQLCGVGGDAGEKRFGALFVLCTRDNPKDVFRCPFGRVIRGMGTLYKVLRTQPVESVYISECGALIPVE